METRIVRTSGKSEAWVTLVLGLDLSYVGAAMVLASALRGKDTRADIVCMVTPDVPQDARQHLALVYDDVVEIPYLQTLALQKYSGRFDAMYNYWLNKSFTKFSLFALVEYKKVIFLDADMLPLESPDALWSCPTPAGICSSVKGPAENDKLHGMPLPRLVIEESLKNGQGHYGVRGCLLIFEPNMEVYKTLREKVDNVDKYGSLESMVGPDEYLITRYFIDKWHHVHAKYGWVSWADRQDLGVDPCFLHYVSQKPWEMGEPWDDFKYWKEEAKNVVKSFPQTLMYFNHVAKTIAEMAEVEWNSEIENQIEEMGRQSAEKKKNEKLQRLEAAKKANIDLVETHFHHVPPYGKKNEYGSAPNSARETIYPRSTLSVCINPPMSARGVGESSQDTLLVKVNPNILVVNGYKRPAGAKPKEKSKPKNNNKQRKAKQNHTTHIDGGKPSVPKLNLNHVNGNEDGALSKNAGSSGGVSWGGNHWRKYNDLPESLSSRADSQNDWRSQSTHHEKGTNSNSVKCQSARNWPNTPTGGSNGGGSKSARRKESNNRKEHVPPNSSRADLAPSWRSTSRHSPVQEWRTTPRNNNVGGLESQPQHQSVSLGSSFEFSSASTTSASASASAANTSPTNNHHTRNRSSPFPNPTEVNLI